MQRRRPWATASRRPSISTGFSGTAHIEGILIRGPGFSDAIHMTSTKPNSIAEIEASRFGGLAACAEPASGAIGGWPKEHPDCFQTWAGPATLRFDKVTCSTVYEGFNLDTNNWADAGGRRYPARMIDIRRTNVRLDERKPNGRQCFAVWSPYTPVPTRLERVHCATGNSGFSPFAPTLGRQRRLVGRRSPRGARGRRRDREPARRASATGGSFPARRRKSRPRWRRPRRWPGGAARG